jgi:hypothetical protein
VTPTDSHGWYVQAATGGAVEYVDADGAMGTGAVQFTTVNDGDYTRFKNDVNVKLADVDNLSYMTKQVSGDSSLAAANLRLYIDNDGDGNFNDVLVYEPYYNGTLTSDWQTWDGAAGYWWSNSQLTYNGHTTTGAGSYLTNFQLSDVLNDKPNTTVLSVGLGTGTSNNPWVVQADALTLNDNTYNFEKTAAPVKVTVANKDECKGNGWKDVYARDGSAFKNQGACVSYVASNGKSQH